MKKLGKSYALLVLLMAAFGCDDGNAPAASKPGNSTGVGGAAGTAGTVGQTSVPNPCGEVVANLATRSTVELFAYSTVPTFDFALPPAAWEALKANARAEQYVEAQACFEGQAIGLVGLRFKGSYGSLYNCFDANGVNTCRKLGMKVKFDKYVKGQHFFGVKRLNFHSYHYDDSYLKERLAYELYGAMDIVVPRATWALLRVNGEPQGLFGMVEDLDGNFTKDRWPNYGDANLYKEVWPGKADDTWITSHLETNTATADISDFKAFSTALNAAAPEALRTIMGQYTDLSYWARYMAVDDAIANFDGITTYYVNAATDMAGNHNFYFYQDAPQHFAIVPWDEESTLSTASGFGYVPPWQTTPADCSLTYRSWEVSDLRVKAPGCDRVFQALSADLTEYHAQAQRLLDGPFALATMQAKIDQYAAFIRAEASADPHGPGATNFEKAVDFLRQDIPRLRNRLEFLQTGRTAVPLQITVGETMGFETIDDYGLTVGTMLLCNANSTTSVEVNSTDPISGGQSLRMLTNFGNEATSWQQWSLYRIPLTASTDLNALTGVRFKARSNVARPIRFDLVSPKDTLGADGIHFGWDIPLTGDTQTIEVLFANAKPPTWGKNPGDRLTDILGAITSVDYQPQCVGRADATGQLPDGKTDNGWIDVDDIEFF
jgi:spore coat protein H